MKKVLFYILTVLTLMFIGLKLADKIDWSWWKVFSPVWILVAFIIVRIGIVLYLYKHDEKYRLIMEKYYHVRREQEHTLADRLKELKEERQKLAKAKIEKWFDVKDKDDSANGKEE